MSGAAEIVACLITTEVRTNCLHCVELSCITNQHTSIAGLLSRHLTIPVSLQVAATTVTAPTVSHLMLLGKVSGKGLSLKWTRMQQESSRQRG